MAEICASSFRRRRRGATIGAPSWGHDGAGTPRDMKGFLGRLSIGVSHGAQPRGGPSARAMMARHASPAPFVRRWATMSDATATTTRIQLRLDRLRAGDASARDELLQIACERLTRLARKMLRGYPGVSRWEQTDDVLQNAAVRLCRALEDVRPESVRSFVSLAAVQIRRELIDLARHYDGPEGPGRHHASRAGSDGSRGPARPAGGGRRHRRPGPAGGLDRVPRADRGAARGGAGALRPALVSGPVPGRGRRRAGRHRAGGQVPLAIGPAWRCTERLGGRLPD